MQGLTLHIFNRIIPVVEIIVDPICDDKDLQSSLVDWKGICTDEKTASFTLQLLNELTANVGNVSIIAVTYSPLYHGNDLNYSNL